MNPGDLTWCAIISSLDKSVRVDADGKFDSWPSSTGIQHKVGDIGILISIIEASTKYVVPGAVYVVSTVSIGWDIASFWRRLED